MRLILNLSEKPNKGTPSVNNNTDREITPEFIQFGRAFPCILQAKWEADPSKVPIWVSKINVTVAYQHSALRPSQVGALTYIVPLAQEDDCIIICINMVLPMGWVDSPKNILCLLGDNDESSKLHGRHRDSRTGLWRNIQNPDPHHPTLPPSLPPHTRDLLILTVIWIFSFMQ